MRATKLSLTLILIVTVIAGLWHVSSGTKQSLLTPATTTALADKKNAAAQVPDALQKDLHIKRSPRIAASSMPAETVWTFQNEGGLNTYALALDELYVPVGAVNQRVHRLPPQPNLNALLSTARDLAAQTGTQPELVLYPLNGRRDEFSRRIVTMKIQVETDDLAAVKAAAAALGLSAWQVPSYAPNNAIAQVDGDPAAPLRVIASLTKLSSVKSAAPLLARQHNKRTFSKPTDTFFPFQWHLSNLGQLGGLKGIDINVTSIWPSLNGTGVSIGIVDDGLQLNHPDLVANVASTGNHNWNSGDPTNPSPNIANEDFHGTAVAGLSAARDNGIGVVGVAPESTLYGLRLISEPTTDLQDSEAMAWRNDLIQIKNNSWGPSDDTPEILGTAGPLWQSAVANGTVSGRGGLGTIYVFAAGNGKQNDDEGTKDAYASDMHVLAVAAITDQGRSTSFSEGGPHLVASAPGQGITTTDLTSIDGYNDGTEASELSDTSYTDSFAGTSASAPIVSGVIALMLEANPNLGWRDVKEILLRSSKQIQPKDSDWVTRDGGQPKLPAIKHHPFYGGGLVDAQAATLLARNWTNLGTETVLTATHSTTQNIPDGGAAILIPLDLNSPSTLRVEHVELTLNITHPYRGDLEIKLISPQGVVSSFATPTLADNGSDYTNWTFSAVRHWGEISRGQWVLSIRDAASNYSGQFVSATLNVHGVAIAAPGINAPLVFSRLVGSSINLPLVTDGSSYTYKYTGLPKGLTYNANTGAINGQAKLSGTFPIVLTATGSGGLVTTLHISLVINPVPFSLRGNYSFQIARDANLNQNLGGYLTLITNNLGSFTGNLILGSRAYSLKGNLEGDGSGPATVTLQIPRPGQSPVLLQLSLPVDNSAVAIRGTLNGTVPVTGWHQGFSTLLYNGRYTFALETPAGSGWPAGYSIGTMVVTSAGMVNWTLQPADGTAALKGSTTVSQDGNIVLFAPVKTPAGSFLGMISLTPYYYPPARLLGSVSWLRGATSSTLYANAAGFGPLDLNIHGGRYTAPPAGTRMLDVSAIPNNVNVIFGGTDVDLGSHAAALDPFVVTLNNQNKVITPNENPLSLKITINPLTGQFDGSFTLTDPTPSATVKRNAKFSGIFLLSDGVGGGYFVLPPLPGSGNGTRSGSLIFKDAP